MKKIKVNISGYSATFRKALAYLLNNLNGLDLIEEVSDHEYLFEATEEALYVLHELHCADCIYVEVLE